MIRSASPGEWRCALADVLRTDVALPGNVAVEGASVVGFVDEPAARQGEQGMSVFMEAARAQGASGVFVIWAGLREDLTCGDGVFVEIDTLPGHIDLVGLANMIDPEQCFRDRWVVFSACGGWAVYGETYGAELAVFVSKDQVCGDIFTRRFDGLLSTSEVIDQFGRDDNSKAARFASLLAEEYGAQMD